MVVTVGAKVQRVTKSRPAMASVCVQGQLHLAFKEKQSRHNPCPPVEEVFHEQKTESPETAKADAPGGSGCFLTRCMGLLKQMSFRKIHLETHSRVCKQSLTFSRNKGMGSDFKNERKIDFFFF